MLKKTAFVFALSVMMIPMYPSVGMCWHHPASNYHHSHGYHGDDALWWGLGALLLGTFIVTASQPPPPPPPAPPVVYVQPPTQVYTSPPYVPPGMCRWERFRLDGYGRMVLDQYGQPVKEYTIGSCQYPPY
ncbi:MAG: hypothetical protein KKA54_15285 [Proteobacteria bacterium]|nr:hypothetical protein [Pseudomonadota bacterium]MBU0967734.1 hypothetical protein [Pseudomonadota bacterium]